MKQIYKIVFTAMFLTLYQFAYSQTCAITGSSEINVNQTLTYSTSSTSGASYFWSVTGGLSIVGSNTGSSISLKGVSQGTGQVCVTKYKAGSTPCCECKSVVISDPVSCPPHPTIYEGTCGGYPSVHPHWRFGLIEDPSVAGNGVYSWSGTYFNYDSDTDIDYVVGRPTSSGYFTVNCTVTYNCSPSGTVTYNLSLTLHTDECGFPGQMAMVYPNPVTSSAYVKYMIEEEGNVSLLLKNNSGEKATVIMANVVQKPGEHEILLEEKVFPNKGTYILEVYVNDKVLSQHRIIKE